MRSNDIIVAVLAGAMFRREGRLMRRTTMEELVRDELNRNFWCTFLILILVVMTISAKGITRFSNYFYYYRYTTLSKFSLIIYGTLYHSARLNF